MSGADLVGSVLDTRFRVDALVGEGRVGGFVYRAVDTTTGAAIAIRTLPGAVPAFPEITAGLAQLSAATDDAERLLAHGTTIDGGQWLAFEWLEGQSLEAHLAEGGGAPRTIGDAITLLEPAARALARAHALGVVHGDVRPANMWLAKLEDGRTRLKLTQFTIGVPAFAATHGAPEHFKTSYGPTGPWTDVYGLALSFVEMVSGKRALRGAEEVELYLETSDIKKRPTLRARGVTTSDAIEAVLQSALAVDPKRRHPDAKAFWESLLAAVPELTPAPPSVRTGAPALPLLVVEAPKSDRRRTFTWIAVAFAAAAIAAIVGVKVAASSAKPSSPAPVVVSVAPELSAQPSAKPDEPSVKVTPFMTDMARIPEGELTMGTDRDQKSDRPAHRVRISKAFTIDRLEVTAEAYQGCIDEGRCTKRQGEGCSDAVLQPKHPANCVDRTQAEQYCAFVGKRLPTEAEWEYAARSGDAREYPWGDAGLTSCSFAIVSSVSGACAERKGTFAVGSAPEGKGPFGTLDMAGNVWEWVADGFEPYPSGDVVDPKVPTGPSGKGVVRGGSWDYSPTAAKTTYRLPWPANAANVSIGFRCAQNALD